MKILYTNYLNGYNEQRNFIKPTKGKIEFRRCRDLFSFLLAFMHKITGKGYRPFLKGLFFNPFISKNKEFRFFNTILIGNNPYEITFESTLPRLGSVSSFWYKIAVQQLAKPNCKKIYAMSQCAYDMQMINLQTNHTKYTKAIMAKMEVKHPFQEPLINSYDEKELPVDKIVFTFIGADFFRKGGMEILKAFDMLIPDNPQIQLNIVSTLNYGDYATHTTIFDQKEALRLLAKHPNNIVHYTSLPNNKVLDLYKKSHIGLLPTWADSYGYSVLEAQAAGCPCITTDIRALPEINNEKIGWVIKISNTDYNTDSQSIMIEQLISIVTNLTNNNLPTINKKAIANLIHLKRENP